MTSKVDHKYVTDSAPSSLFIEVADSGPLILKGATLWRSSETDDGSTKPFLMKCSAQEHKTVKTVS